MLALSGLRSRLLAAALVLLDLASAYTELSDDVLRGIPSAGSDFDINDGALLAPILIPRVPGTDNSLLVQHHFLDFFKSQLPEWAAEIHNSSSKTPATGDRDVPFANLIFRRDPPWAAEGDVNRLTLVAHYDTLSKPEGFVGATDSAAPCAMLLHVARTIEDALAKKWAAMEASGEGGTGLEEEKGVQIILLDGEEAFVAWSASDSLYGSRCVFFISSPVPISHLSTHDHIVLTAIFFLFTGPSRKTGNPSSTPPPRRSKTPSSPSPSSYSSTSSAPSRPRRASRPTSSRPTGPTGTWPRSRSA